MLWRATKALSAAILIAALLAGIPVVLAWLGHNPLPALADFWHAPMARDDGTLFLAVFTLVGWGAWASFAIAVITELPAMFGRTTRHLPGLSTQQWLARTLLSAVAAAIITPTISTATAATVTHHDVPVRVAVVTTASTQQDANAPTAETAPAVRGTAGATHHVQRGDVLLDLAEKYYQDRGAVKAIAEANYGIAQPDGRALERGQTRIYAGWQLRLPVYNGITPTAPASTDAALMSDAGAMSLVSAVSALPQQQAYEVCRGDTLWDIAASQLGDPEAWHDIWTLNKNKTFGDGRTFTKPGLIHAGWSLTMPATTAGHTVTPPPAVPSPPPQSYLDRHAHDGDEAPAPPPQVDILPGDDGVSIPSTAPTAGQHQQPTPSAQEHTSPDPTSEGISLPSGSWIGLGLAAAIALAGRLVWVHRRRLYRPQPPSPKLRLSDSDAAPLPPVVRHVQRQLTALPSQHQPLPSIDRPAASTPVPTTSAWAEDEPEVTPPDAARAVLITALASGGHDLDERGHVVIPAAILAALLPDHDTNTLPPLPRLIVTEGLSRALDWCEEQLLFRRRILISHEADTAAELRDSDPLAEPMPPITLIAHSPDSAHQVRANAILSQGASVNMTATFLDISNGEPPADAQSAPGSAAAGSLTGDETAALLRTVAESHTGFTPQPAETADDLLPDAEADNAIEEAESSRIDGQELDEAEGGTSDSVAGLFPDLDDDDTDTQVPPTRVRITVLGDVKIHDPEHRRAESIRRPSRELAAYLIANGGQARQTTILEDLLPDAPQNRAQGRLDVIVYGLRSSLKQIGGPQLYLDHPRHRYVLNPDAFDVDLWDLRDALARAQKAANRDERIDALREAIAHYTGPFAGDLPYEWKERYVFAISRQVLDARLALAETLDADDPHQALSVLRAAIEQEPQAEEPYRRAMDIHARLGDADGIRDLRRTITRILEEDEIDVSNDLLAHAEELLMQLAKKRPARAR